MNEYQEYAQDQVGEILISAKALLNIETENLLDFIAYLSPFVTKASRKSGYIEYDVREDELTELRFQIVFTEESSMLFNYLNYWCDVFEFSADIFSVEDSGYDERIFLEEDTETYYRSAARYESEYAEDVGADSWEDFRVFRYLSLRESVIEKSSVFLCSVTGLTRDIFLSALEKSHSVEELQQNLTAEYGSPIDFTRLFVEMNVDTSMKDTDEDMELNLFYYENELCISYTSEIKFFDDKRIFPIVVPTIKDHQELLRQHLPAESRIEVKWDILANDEPLNTLMESNFAKRYYPSGNIHIQHEKQWVSPCSICVNRLLNEVEGCRSCEFELIV